MKAKKLPTTIYAKWNDGGGDPFLDCAIDPEGLSDKEEVVEAAEYRLVRKVKIVNKTTVE